MRPHFYTVPTATAMPTTEQAIYQHLATPGNPNVTLVLVQLWHDHQAQDAWEALPGVTEHFPENMSGVAGPGVIIALAPIGATTGMTLRQCFQLLRRWWPVWRD